MYAFGGAVLYTALTIDTSAYASGQTEDLVQVAELRQPNKPVIDMGGGGGGPTGNPTSLARGIIDAIEKYLGSGLRFFKNKAGDPILESQDGLRKVRFDVKNPQGDKPHMHIEEKIGGKWRDATPKHRIYPMGE